MRGFKSHLLSSVSFAASAAEGAAKPDKAIEKVVYMSAEDSLKTVILNVGNAADATLRLIASMVVHLAVRSYHHNDAERRDMKVTKEELLEAFKAYAETKRGRPFEHAWVSRLLAASIGMARSLITDYDKKGVQEGSPLYKVLRAKTANAGVEIVFDFITAKTKGATAFSVLELALKPKKAKVPAPAQTGKTGNAVKASTDKPERIGAAIVSDKGFEAVNAIKGNAKAKAIKMADTMAKTNVDHLTFILRNLLNLTTVEDLMAVAQAATDRAKELQTAKPKRVKKDEEPGTEAAAA